MHRPANPAALKEAVGVRVAHLPPVSPINEAGRVFACPIRSQRFNPAIGRYVVAGLFQMAERLPCKQWVMGSNPVIGSKIMETWQSGLLQQS